MPKHHLGSTRHLATLGPRLRVALLAAATLPIPIATSQDSEGLSLDQLLEVGQAIWESHAPDELKEEYRLPTMGEITDFLAAIETDLAEGDTQSLASYARQAKLSLQLLRNFEGGDALADWLEPRIDYLDASEEIQATPPQRQAPRKPNAPRIKPPASPQFTQEYWNQAIAARPKPKQADRYIPVFKKSFAAKGLPTELAWLSEVESSINLKARSPVGAYGPFQFMPATAERFGLRIGKPDDRTHPSKSATAAASYLEILYKQFQSWPLALAAYNAGEGRVGRAMRSSGAKNFAEVSSHLPTETRMYVPKVLATIAARESIDPSSFR